MVTKILLIIMLVLYVALLIMRYKKKDNPKIEGGVQVVQGILWSLIAVDNWAERSIGMRIVYIIIILCSIRETKQRKGVKAQKRNGWSRWQ